MPPTKLDQDTILRDVATLNTRLGQPAGLATFNRVMAVISLVAGAGFILAAAWFTHRTHMDQAIFSHATTQGVVVKNKWRPVRGHTGGRIGAGGDSYVAIVRFTAQDGRSFTLPDNFGFNPPSFPVGQTITVFYDPEDPQSMMIDRGWKNFVVPGAPGIMGFLMLLGGVQRLFKARKLNLLLSPCSVR